MKLHWLQFAHEGSAESSQSLTMQAQFTLHLRKKKIQMLRSYKLKLFSFWILLTMMLMKEWLF